MGDIINKQNTNESSLYLIIEEPYKTKPSIISESTQSIDDFSILDFDILTENYSPITKSGKVSFRAIVQETNHINKNGRYYPPNVLEEAVRFFQNEIQSRGGLPAEVDHPFVESSDPNVIKRRASQIFIKEVGVLYKKIDFDGNRVIVEGVTLDNPKGQMVYSLIKEGYNVGFSLRAFGKVVPINENGQSYLLVEKLERPLTYDVVINPSHQSARLVEITENEINNIPNNLSLLTESTSTTDTNSPIIVPSIVLPDNTDNISDEDLNNYIQNILNSNDITTVSVNINGETTTVCIDNQFCQTFNTPDFITTLLNSYLNNIGNNIDQNVNNILGGYINPIPVLPMGAAQLFNLSNALQYYYQEPQLPDTDDNDNIDTNNNTDIDDDFQESYIDKLTLEIFDYDINKINQVLETINEKFLTTIDLTKIPPQYWDEFFEFELDGFNPFEQEIKQFEEQFKLSPIELDIIKENLKDEFIFDENDPESYLNEVDDQLVENILKEVEDIVYEQLYEQINKLFEESYLKQNPEKVKLILKILEQDQKLLDFVNKKLMDSALYEMLDEDEELYNLVESSLI